MCSNPYTFQRGTTGLSYPNTAPNTATLELQSKYSRGLLDRNSVVIDPLPVIGFATR